MDLNLTRLRRFMAVYRNASFTLAAEELGMTHSALTKSVQQLDTVTQQNAALVEESAASAEVLSGGTDSLTRSVQIFKL